MLVTDAADTRDVVHRGLVLISLVCCTLVSASFVLFANDQLAGASEHQQQELVSASPATGKPGIIVKRPRQEAQPRRFIDGAAHALTSPFDTFVHGNDQWALRGVPTMFALFVYGVGLGYLARYANGLAE